MKTFQYTQIRPEQIFLPYFEKDFTTAELWTGAQRNEFGNRPSGCDFMDRFAGIIRNYGYVSVEFISKELGVKQIPLQYTITTLTGLTPKEWIDWWLVSAICEMLEKTSWSIQTIAGKLNFTSPNVMGRYFMRHKKVSPREWRNKHGN